MPSSWNALSTAALIAGCRNRATRMMSGSFGSEAVVPLALSFLVSTRAILVSNTSTLLAKSASVVFIVQIQVLEDTGEFEYNGIIVRRHDSAKARDKLHVGSSPPR